MNKVNFIKGLLNICTFWGVFFTVCFIKRRKYNLKKNFSFK